MNSLTKCSLVSVRSYRCVWLSNYFCIRWRQIRFAITASSMRSIVSFIADRQSSIWWHCNCCIISYSNRLVVWRIHCEHRHCLLCGRIFYDNSKQKLTFSLISYTNYYIEMLSEEWIDNRFSDLIGFLISSVVKFIRHDQKQIVKVF